MSNRPYDEDMGAREEVRPARRRPSAQSAGKSAPSGAKRRAAPAAQPAPARRKSSSAARRPPAPKHSARAKRRKRARTSPLMAVLYWVVAITVAFAVSYLVRSSVFEIVSVSGDSMYERMMDGDLAVVTKFDYKGADPARADVVAIRLEQEKGVVLRRVVGLPGETVEIVGGETFINDELQMENYIGLRAYDSFPAITLAPGKYYVLGDNRANTQDSRDEKIGLVNRDQIVGKVRCVVWPLNHLSSF